MIAGINSQKEIGEKYDYSLTNDNIIGSKYNKIK